MEQTRKLELPADTGTPYFCEDQSDFHKLILGHVEALCDNTEDAALMTIGTRVICHEYLALVLSGQMNPYQMDSEWVDVNKEGFRNLIHTINEKLVARGVPTKEGEGGKVEIDYEQIHKDVEGMFDNMD